jgi:hypothetical protein
MKSGHYFALSFASSAPAVDPGFDEQQPQSHGPWLHQQYGEK